MKLPESIIEYCKNNPHIGPSIFFANAKWFGNITEQVSSICDSETYEGIIDQLNDWCCSELNGK